MPIMRITKDNKPVEPAQAKSYFSANLSALNKPKPLIEPLPYPPSTSDKLHKHSETGEELTLKQWSQVLGVTQDTIKRRLSRGRNVDNTGIDSSDGNPNYQYRTGNDFVGRGRKAALITHSETGETMDVTAWANKLDISRSCVHYRVYHGKNPDGTLQSITKGNIKAFVPVVHATPSKEVSQAGINHTFKDRLDKHVSAIDTSQDVLAKPIELRQLTHYKDLPSEYANASVTLDKQDQANLLHVIYDLLQETEATASKLRALLKALPDE